MTIAKSTTAGNRAAYTYGEQAEHNRYLDSLRQEFLSRFNTPIADGRPPSDFDLISTLGAGAFGTVYLARDKMNLTYHAMKSIDKEVVMKKKTIKNLHLEKKILQSVNFPFIISMQYTCKDNHYVYFVIPFEAGGELYFLLKKTGSFSDQLSQFYSAQVVLALEYLHHCNVVHRDLKPENILIAENGYLKLGDFGFSKILKNRTWTLCGTPEYLAPEVLLSKGYSYSVDWWALGVLIFEMIAGCPPFYSTNTLQLYDRILAGQFKAPSAMSRECKSLVKHLLQVDPTKRYGSLKSGVFDIKSHAWFSATHWHDLLVQKQFPPYMPPCREKGSTVNFRAHDEIKLKSSPKCLYAEEFKHF